MPKAQFGAVLENSLGLLKIFVNAMGLFAEKVLLNLSSTIFQNLECHFADIRSFLQNMLPRIDIQGFDIVRKTCWPNT